MKTIQGASFILLELSASASPIKGRRLQEVNGTVTATVGGDEDPTTVAPGKNVTEVSPTEVTGSAFVDLSNFSNGEFFGGVKDWYEQTVEGAGEGESDEPESAGMIRFVTISTLLASTASAIALF